MSEPTFVDRAVMLAKTVASTFAWVFSLLSTVVRGKLGAGQRES